jgi:hypothetical protein
VQVGHRTFNPCGRDQMVASLGVADSRHEERIIEMVRQAFREAGDRWYERLPGQIESLGVQGNPRLLDGERCMLTVHFGHRTPSSMASS